MNRLKIAAVPVLLGLLVVFCGREPRLSAKDVPPKTGHVAFDPASHEAKVLNLHGCKLRDLKEYDSAMCCFRQALELGREHKLAMRMAGAYQNIGTVYSDRAYDFRKYDGKADLDSAIACYDSAYRILTDSGKYNQATSVLTDKAIAYFRVPKYQKRADELFRQARQQAQEYGLVFDEGLVIYHQAQLHADQAVAARNLDGLRASTFMLDTAAMLLRKADRAQTAGSAEELAEEMRQAIREIENHERSRRGGDK
jgi:tetratricopeptide (TPR) repeat protein